MSVGRKIHLFRRTLLILILFSIIIAAHPVGLLSPLAAVVWTPLQSAGINVFMKPFTADMVFMYDEELQQSMYQYDLSVTYFAASGSREIPIHELSFHGWRIPFTWLGVAAKMREDPAPYIDSLCYGLKETFGPGTGFRINSNAPRDASQKYSLNKVLVCDE